MKIPLAITRHHYLWVQEAQARLYDAFPQATTMVSLTAWNHNQGTAAITLRLTAFTDDGSNCELVELNLTSFSLGECRDNFDISDCGITARTYEIRKLISQLQKELNDATTTSTPVNLELPDCPLDVPEAPVASVAALAEQSGPSVPAHPADSADLSDGVPDTGSAAIDPSAASCAAVG